MNSELGIVVPTMGTRPEFLRETLASIGLAGSAIIHIVAPPSAQIESIVVPNSYNALIPDPGKGLSAAIDAGLRSFPTDTKFVTWIGDDDLLLENSLNHAAELLTNHPEAVLVYGGCEYIDTDGNRLWVNKSGSYARYLMRFGPQLVPQPGSLFRKEAYESIGGLDPQYKWAFDLDLFIRFSRIGKLHFIPRTLARFRWHDGSLSVGGRRGSIDEASRIRRTSLPASLQWFSPLWEAPIKAAIKLAGNQMSKRQKRPTQ